MSRRPPPGRNGEEQERFEAVWRWPIDLAAHEHAPQTVSDDADAIAAAYLYAAKCDPTAALTQAVSDAVVAIEELRCPWDRPSFTRGEFVTRRRV